MLYWHLKSTTEGLQFTLDMDRMRNTGKQDKTAHVPLLVKPTWLFDPTDGVDLFLIQDGAEY